jgi:hypothetical protein
LGDIVQDEQERIPVDASEIVLRTAPGRDGAGGSFQAERDFPEDAVPGCGAETFVDDTETVDIEE